MRKRKPKDPNRRNKAFKYRMYPNKEQRVLFAKTFGCVRFIYNKALYISMESYEATGKSNIIPYARFKEEHDWLREVDSLALANAQLNLESSYSRFFDMGEPRHTKSKIERAERNGKELTFYDYDGHPKFKRKKDGKSYTTNRVGNNIELLDQHIKLPKLGKVRIKKHREPTSGYTLKSATISQTATGKYFVSVLYEYSKAIEPIEPVTAIGFDFAMQGGYADSNGGSGKFPRHYSKMETKLAREQRRLDHMVEGSSNYNKQLIKLNRIHEKITNQRRDFLHKKSREIANSCDLVGMEDINMRGMARSLKFGKSVHDAGWGMFREFLKYKLEEQGKRYIVIDKWFPSSKLCSTTNCGFIYKDLKLGEEEWDCPLCGTHHDRNDNAAINIEVEAVRVYHSALVNAA